MSSKKSLVIFFNCHGKEIYKILNKYQPFTNEYDLSYIPLHNHFENDISNIQKELIKNADVLIIQFIKNKRKFVHHDIIIPLTNPKCKIIMLPHYVFSGYFINFNINRNFDKSQNKFNEYLNIGKDISKNDIINFFNHSLLEFQKTEEISSIKMFPIVKDLFKKHLLFNSRSYPTSLFFNYVSIEILKLLNISTQNYKFIDKKFAKNVETIILPYVKKVLQLEFDVFNKEYLNISYNAIDYLLAYIKTIDNNDNLIKCRGNFLLNLDYNKTNHLNILKSVINK